MTVWTSLVPPVVIEWNRGAGDDPTVVTSWVIVAVCPSLRVTVNVTVNSKASTRQVWDVGTPEEYDVPPEGRVRGDHDA